MEAVQPASWPNLWVAAADRRLPFQPYSPYAPPEYDIPLGGRVVVKTVTVPGLPDFSRFGSRRKKEIVRCQCGCPETFETAINNDGSPLRKYFDQACRQRARRTRQAVDMGRVTARGVTLTQI